MPLEVLITMAWTFLIETPEEEKQAGAELGQAQYKIG